MLLDRWVDRGPQVVSRHHVKISFAVEVCRVTVARTSRLAVDAVLASGSQEESERVDVTILEESTQSLGLSGVKHSLEQFSQALRIPRD